jgi:hypothetical protein
MSLDTLRSHKSQRCRMWRSTARNREASAPSSIAKVFEGAGYGLENYSEAVELLRQHARIVLHFHPDRLGRKPVLGEFCKLPEFSRL